MKHSTVLFMIFVFLTSCDFKSANDYFVEAEKLEEVGKYKEAILVLDKAIAKDDKLLGAYINRGADKSALNDFKGAISDYEKVLKLDTGNTLALYNIGNNYKRLGNYKSAIEFYNKAFDTKGGAFVYLDFTPNNVVDMSDFDVPGYQIHYERGLAYYNIDSLQKAVNDFVVSINDNYMTAECHYWLGQIYTSTGQIDAACKNFRRSKELGYTDAALELKKYCNE